MAAARHSLAASLEDMRQQLQRESERLGQAVEAASLWEGRAAGLQQSLGQAHSQAEQARAEALQQSEVLAAKEARIRSVSGSLSAFPERRRGCTCGLRGRAEAMPRIQSLVLDAS